MNKVTLIGNLARDISFNIYEKDGGKKSIVIASSVLAVDKPRSKKRPGQKPTANFIPIASFNQLAITMADNLAKGSRIGITGKLKTKRWTDKNGHRRFDMEVIVDRMDFLTPKKKD
jgi:single-strand DNA-binding protein